MEGQYVTTEIILVLDVRTNAMKATHLRRGLRSGSAKLMGYLTVSQEYAQVRQTLAGLVGPYYELELESKSDLSETYCANEVSHRTVGTGFDFNNF